MGKKRRLAISRECVGSAAGVLARGLRGKMNDFEKFINTWIDHYCVLYDIPKKIFFYSFADNKTDPWFLRFVQTEKYKDITSFLDPLYQDFINDIKNGKAVFEGKYLTIEDDSPSCGGGADTIK